MGLALRVIGQKQSATEQQLVAAVRQGDDRAFEELFARYRSRIAGYVLGMVRDHARAEDITQEVFLSALRRLRDTERPIAFKPWIYEIARNACIDEFRRTRRATEISLNADDDSASGDGNLVSSQPTPDAAMENKQRLEALRDAFRGLSENHHRVLVMRELEGLSYAEIAHRLGMSRPMVESTLFRARRRLGEEYEELSSGRRCRQVCEVVDRADTTTLRVLGIRARRQVALHLSHCDDCRRHARLAGADEALFRAPTFTEKIAALLPFGWLGRRLGSSGHSLSKRSAHGFVARQASSAAQYADAVSSSGVLGRVAAAVLVFAAAGGGYAGVTLSSNSAPAHKAAASQASGSQSLPSTAGQAQRAGQAAGSTAATAAALRAGRGTSANPGARPAGHAGARAVATKPGHGRTGPSSGGGASSSARSTATGTQASSSHRGILPDSPVGGVLGSVQTPITPKLPSPGTNLPKPSLHLPSTPSLPNAPTVPSAPSLPSVPNTTTPQVTVPNPKTIVGQAGQTAGSLTGSANQALGTVTTPIH